MKEGGDSLGAEMTDRNVWGRRKPGMVRGQVSRGLWEHEPLWGKAGLERQAGIRQGGSSFQTEQLEACPWDAAGLQQAKPGGQGQVSWGSAPWGLREVMGQDRRRGGASGHVPREGEARGGAGVGGQEG